MPALPPLADLVLTRHLDAQEYDKLPVPEAPPLLRWNLAANAKHVLTLRQNVTIRESSVPVGVAPVVVEGYTQAEGTFVVEGRGQDEPGKARIWLKVTRQEFQAQPLPDEAIRKMEASAIEYAIAPEGALTRPRRISGSPPQLLEVVYALPTKALAPGESAEIEPSRPAVAATNGAAAEAPAAVATEEPAAAVAEAAEPVTAKE